MEGAANTFDTQLGAEPLEISQSVALFKWFSCVRKEEEVAVLRLVLLCELKQEPPHLVGDRDGSGLGTLPVPYSDRSLVQIDVRLPLERQCLTDAEAGIQDDARKHVGAPFG